LFVFCSFSLLAIVLSAFFFWPLYCLPSSFGHCIVCLLLLAIVLSAFFDVRFGLPLWYLQTFLKYISSELYSTQDICYNIWEIAIIYTRYVIIYEWYIIIFVRYIIIYERFTPQQMYMYWLYTFILLFILLFYFCCQQLNAEITVILYLYKLKPLIISAENCMSCWKHINGHNTYCCFT
jgi:hypothetical protein